MSDHFDNHPKPRPIVGWAGGKQRLLKYIRPLIPPHICYCEVFFGGGAVYWDKAPARVEVINDIHGELISFYRCVKYHLDALLDELDFVLNSRREFEDYGRQPGLTDIQRAARWFIRNKLSFGGQGQNFAIARTRALASRAQRLIAIQALNQRLDHTTIEQSPWEYILKSYDSPDTLFFVDPPYLDDGGQVYKGWSEHELGRFCAALPKLKGSWIFTFQDCPQVRDLMTGYPVTNITRANGIGNNGKVRSGRKYREVVFTDRQTASKRKAA